MRLTKFIALAALVMALAAAEGEALAQEYAARCTALTTQIKDLPGLPQADRDRMTAAIADYCGKRATCLASVRGAMQSKAVAKLDGAWPDCVTRPPLDAIDKGLNALSPEVAFKLPALPLYSIGQQEAAFFQALNASLKSVAMARDEVFAAWGDVTTYARTVRDTEWPKVQSSSAQFCKEVTAAADVPLYAAATHKAQEAASRTNTTAGNFAKALIVGAISVVSNVDPGDVVVILGGAKDTATAVVTARTASVTRAAVDRAINGSSGTMQLYITLREYLRVFLGSYTGREAKLVEAGGALDKLVAAAAAPGQADDAKLLAGQLRPELVALGAEYVKAVEDLDRLNRDQIIRMRDQIACTEPWARLQSRISGEQSGNDLSRVRRTMMDALSFNYGPYQSEFDRRVAPAIREADAALEAEMRARAEDLRAVEDGVRKSRQ